MPLNFSHRKSSRVLQLPAGKVTVLALTPSRTGKLDAELLNISGFTVNIQMAGIKKAGNAGFSV
jgi:hypothetical protein